jgi:membrane-associated phospholipid phosphatase
MIQRRWLGWVLSLFVATRAAGAQALGPERQDINDLRGDIWSVVSSPAHLEARDISPVAGALAATTTLSLLGDSAIYAWMQTHPDALVMRVLTPFREDWKFPLYEFGSGQSLLPLSGALWVAGRLSRSVGLRDAGLGCAAGHLSSAGLREVLDLLVGRERPRVTPDPDELSFPGGFTWDDQSFPSGHIDNSMACASFLSHRFHLGLFEPLMYTYPTAIGAGRLADGRHWPSDVLAGAFMGYAIGQALAARQEAREAGRERTQPPTGTAASALPLLRWSIQF